MVEPVLPEVAEEILSTIGQEIPEYARPLEGAFGRGVHRGVAEALGQFVGLIRDPDADRGPSREIYIALGRGEFANGRALDALQTAYRIGARVAWRRIASASLEAGLDGTTLSLLAESIFVYINELSADSTEGYAEAQSELVGERLRQERQLVISMLGSPPIPIEDLGSQATTVGWTVPKRLAALVCHESDLAEITRILPIGVISAPVDGLGCVAVPDASGPGRYKQLREAIGDRRAGLGPDTGPTRLRESWQLARTAFAAAGSGTLESDGLIRAEEHLVELTIFESRNLIERLSSRCLEPLASLTPKSRLRMTETASAFIQHQGNAAEMARSLHIHPQTARYRLARLRELFGDDLDDPDSRFEIELSLRAAGTP
ncbi:MAG: helix-turn-helix domain-containing protein [Solirubrobacterales bacterium]|nr:helix-turn-helix domain-containing protein [Solirubrobacterales bacterium]